VNHGRGARPAAHHSTPNSISSTITASGTPSSQRITGMFISMNVDGDTLRRGRQKGLRDAGGSCGRHAAAGR